ncbi:hypothetical protein Q9251_04410 [Alkalihalobacillus macyae]|nr:hypothetical protein [Alkalihalobacillus macyae]MDP4550122.1 hypothetical protein [Alkalihalobacillus macyae]
MTRTNQIKLEAVEQNERFQYVDYLLLDDESEVEVNKYINDGDM